MADWWLVTWATYASWLPGDPRGFRTWRRTEYVPPPHGRALGGEPTYRPENYAARYQLSKERCGPAVILDSDQFAAIETAIVKEVAQLAIEPAILSVDRTHVHFVARFGDCGIRPTVGRLKSAATRTLHGAGLESRRIWAKNCHMESLIDSTALESAVRYVRKHEGSGAKIHLWKFEY